MTWRNWLGACGNPGEMVAPHHAVPRTWHEEEGQQQIVLSQTLDSLGNGDKKGGGSAVKALVTRVQGTEFGFVESYVNARRAW